MESSTEGHDFAARLDRIESLLEEIAFLTTIKATTKEWYTPSEFAALVGKKRWTICQACNLGRIAAKKRPSGRGHSGEWMISHEELTRYREEGPLPERAPYRHVR